MAKNNKHIKVKEQDQGERLDVFLSVKLDSTRSKVQKIIRSGLIIVDDKTQKKTGFMLKAGQVIEILPGVAKSKQDIERDRIAAKAAEKIRVVAENKDYLVISKPAGLLVHPTEAEEPHSLVAFLLSKYPQIKKVGESDKRPGIVHRLDKDASGLLVVARTQAMFESLKKQFKARQVEKQYLVLVHGVVEAETDTIDFEIDRGEAGKMVARPKTDKLKLKNVGKALSGKKSISEFVVEKRFARYTLLRVNILSGRTHQIRVHMLAYGHPVVGDMLYFNKKLNRKKDMALGRLFLHAARLCFSDLDKKRVCFEDPLPGVLKNFLKSLN